MNRFAIKKAVAELNLITGLMIAVTATDQLLIQAIGTGIALVSLITLKRIKPQ